METYFTRIKEQVRVSLDRTGFIEELGEEHFHRSLYRALSVVWEKLDNESPCERGCPKNCPLNQAELPEGVVHYRV